jgi:hypothetical protein
MHTELLTVLACEDVQVGPVVVVVALVVIIVFGNLGQSGTLRQVECFGKGIDCCRNFWIV